MASSKSSKARDYAILTIVVLIVGGAVAGFGFYKDEVTAFMRLEGWNLAPVTQQTERFLEAAAKGDGSVIEPMLTPSMQRITPVKKSGKLTGFSFSEYGASTTYPLKKLVPDAGVKPGKPKLVPLDGGAVTVAMGYKPHDLELRWDKTPQGWRITNITVTEKARGGRK